MTSPLMFVHYSRLKNATYADNTECCGIPFNEKLRYSDDPKAITCPKYRSEISESSRIILESVLPLLERRIKDGIASSREIHTFLKIVRIIPTEKLGVGEHNFNEFVSELPIPTPNEVRMLMGMKPVRPEWDEYFLDIAKAVSTRADCTRRQVGAVVVDWRQRIISTGYNGAKPGGPSCLAGECPRGRKSKEEVAPGSSYDTGAGSCIALHAEQNALLYSDYTARAGGIIYITCAPCDGCLRMLEGSGLTKAVFYSESGHRDEIQLQPKGYIK